MRTIQHEPASAWQPGDRITVRGASWTIVRRTAFTDCDALSIASTAHGRRTLLVPFDRPRAATDRQLRAVRIRRWIHGLRDVILETHPYGGLRVCPAGLRLLPYQLEPAIAILRDGSARVLIADGVGLGKTIQAGLIVCELAQASDTFRALILTPAGLRHQWHGELTRHFAVASIGADAQWLRSALREIPADVNPWSPPGVYIASFDFVKRPEALRPLEDVRWDLVVVDEAHAATIGTDRRAAVDAIAMRARGVILLTATPHPGDSDQFAALCRIGAGPHAPPPVFFQRRRAPPANVPARRSTLLMARPHAAERRMHRLLDAYTTRVWQESARAGSPHARLASIVLRKRALSSARSLAVSARRRIDLLVAAPAVEPAQLPLPLGPLDNDEDPLEDAVPDAELARPALGDPDLERRLLLEIAEAAEAASACESKVRVLSKLLKRIPEPVLVFTEYRDTLERLAAALAAAGTQTTAIHGGMSPAERIQAVAAFNQGGHTLLATDAASEGLNLQESCRIVLHFELPWNPLRVEQRAGRVDRIGQTRRVHEIALVASDTSESLVLGPLVRRASGWNGCDGLPLRLTESRIAEMLIGGLPIEQPADPATARTAGTNDYVDAANAEVTRLLEHRRLARGRERPRPQTFIPVWQWSRPRDMTTGVALIFVLAILDGCATIVHTEPVAAHVPCAVPESLRRAADIKGWARRTLHFVEPAAAARVLELARQRIGTVRPGYQRALAARRQRENDLSATLPPAAAQLVQAGLFDRRAVNADAARRRAATALREQAETAIEALGNAGRLTASVELRAILIIGPSPRSRQAASTGSGHGL